MAWVATNATVTFTAVGEILPSRYYSQGRGEYKYYATVLDASTSAQIWQNWNSAGTDVIPGGGPYAAVPFSQKTIGSWTNTGASKTIVVKRSAVRSYAGAGTNWDLGVEVTGGNGDAAPACGSDWMSDSEFFGPNPALRYQIPCQACAGDPVDTRTGNLYMAVPGIAVSGRGPGLAFSLAYNSLNAAADPGSGFGWSNSLQMRLQTAPDGSRVVVQETGATVRFVASGSGGWSAPPRFSGALVSNGDGTATFTRRHFERFKFSEADGRLLSIADQFSNTTTVHYPSGSSKADYLIDSAMRKLLVAWNTGGRLQSVTDQMSGSGGPRLLAFTYDAATGDLLDYQDASGGHWVFTYDSSHRMLTMRKPRQSDPAKVIENHYDWSGRVDWQEDELNRRTSLAYDTPAVGSTRITHPDSAVQVDRFVDGRREETTLGVGTADQTSTRFTYNPDTLALGSVTDNDNKVTLLDQDASGNQTYVKDPTGRVTRSTYNAFDQVTSVSVGEVASPPSTTNVVTSTSTYDALGRPLVSTSAVGTADESVTSYTYDTAHPEDVTGVTDGRGKVWHSTYEPLTGDRLTATDPLGNSTAWTFNNVGWLLTETAPKGPATPTAGDFQTSYSYDVAGRSTTVIDPTGEKSRTVLDANGNVASSTTGITATPGSGDVTTYAYTDADELSVVDPPGTGSKGYTYWPAGQRKRATNENGGHWDYAYDFVGRLKTATDPVGGVAAYRYDAAGRLKDATQSVAGASCTATIKVGCTSYSYDAAGRPTAIDYSDPATPDVTGIGYDSLGRRTNATSSGVVEAWAWDKQSRLTSATDANSRQTLYGWDDNSNLTSITYPGQTTPLTRTFDDAGRFSAVTDWQGRTTNFGYDANANWTGTTFPTSSANTDVFGYDPADRMTSATWKQGATTLGSETYTRPLKGMVDVTTPTGAAGTVATDHNYDNRDRLEAAGSDTYTYDPASNLTKTADGTLQVFDPAQRLCWSSPTATTGSCTTPASDATTYTYDSRGNRTAADTPTDVPQTFAYDQANRLTAASSEDLAAGGAGQYHEISSKRILDTRGAGTGTCSPSPCSNPLVSGVPLSVTVGGGTIPTTNVAAVAATVTILDPNLAGYARVNSSGSSAAATLNFDAHEVVNRFAIIPVVADQIRLDMMDTGRSSDVSVDVTGYYTTAAGAPGATYNPIAPATRLVDTRYSVGVCPTATCTTLGAGSTVTVQAAGRAGLAATGLRAAVLAVSIPTPAATGYLRVAPGTTSGAAGTMNYRAGEGINDVIVVPIDANGRFTLVATSGIDVIIDVAGYFTIPAPGGPTGAVLSTVTPYRAADTRVAAGTCTPNCNTLTAGQQVKVKVRGLGAIPDQATTVVAFLTVTVPASTGYLRVNPIGAGTGTGGAATINYDSVGQGMTIMAPIAADGTITIAANTATDVIIDLVGYYAPPSWTYTYDSSGIRSAKTSPAGVETTFTWTATGGLPLLLGQHTGSDTTWIIYGPGGQPIEEINGTTPTYLHHDQLGSVRLATNTTGANVGTKRWDAYGNLKATTGTTTPLLGYAGQYTDTETGLQYLRARYYDPKSAQFLTQDPTVATTGEPYGYAGDNPVNASDPLGLECSLMNPSISGCAAAAGETIQGGVDAVERTGGRAKEMVEDPSWACRVYCDDISNVASVVTAGSAAICPFTLGAACAVAEVSGAVGTYASVLFAGTTCAKGLDSHCAGAVMIAVVSAATYGVGHACAAFADIDSARNWGAVSGPITLPFIGLSTTERPEDQRAWPD